MAELQVEQSDKTLILSKDFDAPKTVMFEMFKNPEHLEKWWGPETWPATIKTFEFEPGGTWLYYMTGPDGTQSWGKSTFESIDEPNAISYVDAFADENGNVNTELPQGKVTVTFAEHDGRTTVTVTAEYQSAEEVQQLIEMGMVEGIKDTWSQLERLVAQMQAA